MGCDIHAYAEIKEKGKWEFTGINPFDFRSYGLFGFLAGVRNYSEAEPIAKERGVPSDLSPEVSESNESWDSDGHSHSWVSLKELLDFDYEKKFHDMRVTRDGNGAARARSLDEAEHTTYREFLGHGYFKDLDELKELGDPANVRIVFWFDN